jgi:hypothetical protein
MEFNGFLAQMKTDEIKDHARKAINRFSWAEPSIADSAVQAFVHITPPPSQLHTMFIPPGGTDRGYSRKPGNIYLHWEKLINVVPEVMITTIGALELPYWVWPLIGLHLWNKIWRSTEEDLSEVGATIIYALWKDRNGYNKISEDDGYDRTNSSRNQHGMPDLSRSEYNIAVNHLLQMECI